MTRLSQCEGCGVPLSHSADRCFCARCLLRGALKRVDPALPPEPPPARVFCDYELLEEMGRGGMGVVWKARHIRLGRVVALKMLSSGLLATDVERRRFAIESEATAHLDQPHIVPIYGADEHDGRAFLTMKLIEGGTLASRLASLKAPLPIRDSVTLLLKVAQAVQYAHERGILHRDLKPGNILLDAAGEPYVTDFGLARFLGNDSSLTLSGTPMGTPGYMAPEQATGRTREITTAADLFSLGAIFYELLTGRAPFAAETPLATLQRVVNHEPPRPGTLNRAVDRDLETICLKCLEKAPDRRYASAKGLADELERWLRHEPILARPSGAGKRIIKWTRRRPLTATLVAIGLTLPIIIVTVLATANTRVRRQRELMRLNLYAADVALASQSTAEGNVTLTRRILNSHRPVEGERDLRGFEWRYLWNESEGREIATLAGHSNKVTVLSHTPDGAELVSGSYNGTVLVWDLRRNTLKEQLPHRFRNLTRLAIAPDKSLFAIGADDGTIQLWHRAGQKVIRELHASPGSTFGFAGQPSRLLYATAASADFRAPGRPGSSHSFVRLYDWQADIEVVAWHLTGVLEAVARDGGTVATLLPESRIAEGSHDRLEIHDSLTGRLIASEPIGGYSVVISGDGRRVAGVSYGRKDIQISGNYRMEAPRTLIGHGGAVLAMSLSANGRRLASASEDQTVCLWDAASGERLNRLPGHLGPVSAVEITPDGTRLASGGVDGLIKIWNCNSARRSWFPGQLRPPYATSRSGRYLAARTEPNRNSSGFGCAIFDYKTTKLIEIGNPANASPAFFTRAEESISLVMTQSSGFLVLKTIDWSTGNILKQIELAESQTVTSAAAVTADLSTYARGGLDGTVLLWNTTNGAVRRLGGGPAAAASLLVFSPDNRILASVFEGKRQSHLRFRDLTDGHWMSVTNWSGNKLACLAFSPDGRLVAAASSDGSVPIWDAKTGRLTQRILDLRHHITWIDFAPDGKTLASTYASGLGALKCWHLPTGREIAVIHQGESCPRFIQFTPDGTRLLGVDWFGAVHQWEAPFE